MKKLICYIKGALIGMIAEYSFRIEFGYLQAFILTMLLLGLALDVIYNWNK